MSDKTFLILTRVMIFVCAVLVIIPALKLSLMLPIFFWTFSFAIPVFGVYLIGMLWKVNRVAAWTTILAGYAANFLWTFSSPTWLPDIISHNVVYPTIIATVLVGVVMNLILPGDPPYMRKLKAQMQETTAGV